MTIDINSGKSNGQAFAVPADSGKLEKRPKWDWGRVGKKSFVALLLIGNLAASALVACLIILTLAYTRMLAQKPPAALVQLSDGTSIAVQESPSYEREPTVIRKFVSDSLIYLMNWSADLPHTEPVSKFDQNTPTPRDQGVDIKIENGLDKKVTTPAWQASFTLEETFRTDFLEKLAKMTPSEIFSGQQEVVLKLRNVSHPNPLPDTQGAWSVDVVADLMLYSQSSPQGRAVPFNKRVYVRAIEAPAPPNSRNLSALAAAIYAVRLSGLEITGMRDIQLKEFAQ